jgi:hypothetical protein
LRTFNPTAMTITADTASERAYLPKPFRMKNRLLLADAGYPDFEFLPMWNAIKVSILFGGQSHSIQRL